MMSFSHVRVGLLNLKANKVRSILSMLGIVIGTGSVIVVVSIVNGIRKATIESMTMGSTNMVRMKTSFSKSSGRIGALSLEDVDRLKRLRQAQSVLPEVISGQQVKGPQGKAMAQTSGANTETVSVNKFKILDGRDLDISDIQKRRRVCLISAELREKVFGFVYPIGSRLRVGETALEVIGVFEPESKGGFMARKTDLLVSIPILFRIDPNATIQSIEVRSEDGKVDLLKAEMLQYLESRGPGQKDLYEVEDPREFLKDLDKWAKALMIQVVLIAGISLLVGGIGLMNVMLTTVAERTREIGLRKALGASAKMVQNQFLIESAVLSGLGGLAGMGCGYFICKGIEILSAGKFFVAIPPVVMFGSFFFSLILGIVFGLYPASKAAHLSPVEALRYE